MVLNSVVAHAFPPAPYYRLFGIVRDQVGQTIVGDNVEVVLLKGGRELVRTPIRSTLIDQNYQLDVRIDQNRGGTALYSENAVASGGQFSLAVSMNEQWFYPIEVSGNLTAGKGGERIRLDLTLGEDSDRDGLPDVWESWQLYQAGMYPDGEGLWDLSLLDKDGDFDGDGQSNWLEYVAGTFAGDATENFRLEIKEKQSTAVRFEFYAITGKVYTIERTRDMRTWTRVPFALGLSGSEVNAHEATGIGVMSAFVVPGSHPNEFYRLTVR